MGKLIPDVTYEEYLANSRSQTEWDRERFTSTDRDSRSILVNYFRTMEDYIRLLSEMAARPQYEIAPSGKSLHQRVNERKAHLKRVDAAKT